MTIQAWTLLLSSFLLATLLIRKYVSWYQYIKSTPPGPTPIPILGNFFSIPLHEPWKTYAEWRHRFKSDLLSIRAPGQLVIVVNTDKAARELFGKRAQNYSDKPHIPSVELIGWGWNTGLLPYGESWRNRRRLLHQFLHVNAFGDHLPVQNAQVAKFLLRIKEKPEGFLAHVKALATGVAMGVAYGHEVTDDDPYVKTSEAAVKILGESSVPGISMLINAMPSLQYLPSWLPGGGFRALALKCRELTTTMRFEPLKEVQKKIDDGTALPSMARSLLLTGSNTINTEMIADVTAIIYAGGGDTSTSTITAAISALASYPEVQRRAQAEIDSIVGRNRLPTIDDRPILPYVEAICREVVRWHIVVPLGVVRMNTHDDVYNGWHIPKGTNIFWNVWGMAHDPEIYPEPFEFRPERLSEKFSRNYNLL